VVAAGRPAPVRITRIPVSAPLVDVTMRVEKTPGVGRETAYRSRFLPVDALLALATGVIPVVVCLASRDRLAEVEPGGRPRPAVAFPLRLGGQPVAPAVALTQLLAERLAVLPGDIIDWQLLAVVGAGVAPHDGQPLRLSDRMHPQEEPAR